MNEYQKVVRGRDSLKKLPQLMEKLAEQKEADVIVEGTAYPGTTVNIGELSMIVKKPVQYSRFVVKEGDVRLAPI